VIRAHRSLLIRFLRDPSRELAHALEGLAHAASQLLPFGLGICALAAALVVARAVLARVRERRLAAGARLIELAVPPELDTDGALLLWSALHDLLRPPLARLLTGQPQIAWEIAADRGGSRFRLWIPGAVPPGLVERALASAWPGITTTPLEQPAGTETDVGADTGVEDV
jgi:hypothetical protein